MREIKFRAWDGKAFRESFVIHQCNGMAMIMIDDVLTFKPDWVVEQYTGLKDKNGREIYEGDIIEYKDMNINLSELMEWTGCVRYLESGFFIDTGSDAIPVFDETAELKIIGNIHKNPELLESK